MIVVRNPKVSVAVRFRKALSTISRVQYPVCIVGGGPVGLLMSAMLSDYGVDHCLIERRVVPTMHPQAHFVNCRSMEILQGHLPEAFTSMVSQVSRPSYWRDFSYCHSITGRQLARVDHFTETDPSFWDQSPTNIVHLPQNRFEVIMRSEVQRRQLRQDGAKRDTFFGYEAFGFRYIGDKCQFHVRQSQSHSHSSSAAERIAPASIQCDYLIAADGASSPIRNSLGISLEGNKSLQTLMNVHFTCEGLFEKLRPRPAMLYFVFNETTVSVFIAHDPLKDEWVCQIPIFPPFRSPQDYDVATVTKLIYSGLGLNPQDPSTPKLKILTINSWTMNAQVADKYTDENCSVFLVGDAAHRFPPAGGFGMNTGIQDAHNLAWKLALVQKGLADRSLLRSYDSERRKIALENTAFSMRNYAKSAGIARSLGVDPAIAEMTVQAAENSISSLIPMALRKAAVNAIFDTGLSSLAFLKTPGNLLGDVRVNFLRSIVEKKDSLGLIFPKEDIDFEYTDGAAVVPHSRRSQSATTTPTFLQEKDLPKKATDTTSAASDADDKDKYHHEPKLCNGGRIPHAWFSVGNRRSCSIKTTTTTELSGGDDVFVSSVNLSAWLHQIDLNSRLNNSHIAATGNSLRSLSLFPSPRVILLVDASEAEQWLAAIDDYTISSSSSSSCTTGKVKKASEVFQVIAVSPPPPPHPSHSSYNNKNEGLGGDNNTTAVSTASSGAAHTVLQDSLQIPRFSINDPESELSSISVTSQHDFLRLAYDTHGYSSADERPPQQQQQQQWLLSPSEDTYPHIHQQSSIGTTAGTSAIHLVDVSGRWMKKCQEYRQSLRRKPISTTTSSPSALQSLPTPARDKDKYLPVAVRPDGHIAAICDVPVDDNTSDPQIMKYFIDSIRIALRFHSNSS